jgi:hypothetical protein
MTHPHLKVILAAVLKLGVRPKPMLVAIRAVTATDRFSPAHAQELGRMIDTVFVTTPKRRPLPSEIVSKASKPPEKRAKKLPVSVDIGGSAVEPSTPDVVSGGNPKPPARSGHAPRNKPRKQKAASVKVAEDLPAGIDVEPPVEAPEMEVPALAAPEDKQDVPVLRFNQTLSLDALGPVVILLTLPTLLTLLGLLGHCNS